MKRNLSPEQIEKRDARRAKFRAMWKQVAAMPELERIEMSNKLGFVNVEGRQFGLCNMMLLALQAPAGSVFGGFRQWLKQGRAVRKGEHGAMIWVPISTKSNPNAQPPRIGQGITDAAPELLSALERIVNHGPGEDPLSGRKVLAARAAIAKARA